LRILKSYCAAKNIPFNPIIQAPRLQLEMSLPPVSCGGDGIGNTLCARPVHKITRQGQTYCHWFCSSCGGKYRAAINLAGARQSRWQRITRHLDHAADDCRWQALR
jgi:hypothetical protein